MEQLVKKIVTLASKLEDVSAEYSEIADNIALSLVKTAQYVGSQGYWVRNERCWSNCYRQKRASSPKKASQEIWFECQSEYQDSINTDGSDWDKYAESESVVKNASVDQKIVSKIKNGADFIDVLSELSTEASSTTRDVCLQSAESILNIADSLADKYPLLHKEAVDISSELLKESWNWNPFKKKQQPVQAPQNTTPSTFNPSQSNVLPIQNQKVEQKSEGFQKLMGQLKSLYVALPQGLDRKFLALPGGQNSQKELAITKMQELAQNAINVKQNSIKQIEDLMNSTIEKVEKGYSEGDINMPPQNYSGFPAGTAVPQFGSNPGLNFSLAPNQQPQQVAASNKQKVIFKL